MNAEQPTTSSTPPQASTVVRDSIKQGQSAMAPPAPTVQGVYAPPPQTTPSKANDQHQIPVSQNPMQHVITLEHGADLRGRCTIHEKILCDYSESMRNFSVRAEVLRESYNKCDDYLDRIESITMVGLTPEQYEGKKLGVTLLPLIMAMENNCPLQEYQKTISKAIREMVDQQFTNKNLVYSAETPKSLKLFQGLTLNKRLHLLNSEGALEVAEEVCAQLQRFKATEKQKAKNNINKAWAQGRLLLRGANEKSVQSFVDWAYRKTLSYEDVEHLYDLWTLATRLKVVVLAEECMNRLYETASNSIYTAVSNGVPLRYLLGLAQEQDVPDPQALSDDSVTVVFRHVLKDENPPPKLSQLVIHTMAKGMDSEMWAQLQNTVNQNIANRLIAVMVAYREVKSEPGVDDGTHVKLEKRAADDSAQPAMAEAHSGSASTG